MQLSFYWEAEQAIPEPLLRDLRKLIKLKEEKLVKNLINKEAKKLSKKQERILKSFTRYYRAKFKKIKEEKDREEEELPVFKRKELTKGQVRKQKAKISKARGVLRKLERMRKRIEKRVQMRDEDES